MNTPSFLTRVLLCAALLFLDGAAEVGAAPPLEPLPPPLYSFDANSPSVLDGTVLASDVLIPGPDHPVVVIPGPLLGLVFPQDDLDGLSGPHPALEQTDTFLLLFSVDAGSVGLVPPDPFLFDAEVPYNAFDQAQRGHAGGDQYIGTTPFTLSGPLRRGSSLNNCLSRNNFDEGGTDFVADPPTHAGDYVDPSLPEDDVDGMQQPSPRARGSVGVYFSATGASPSVYESLPGSSMPSGAHVYFNPDPLGGTITELYASFFELGLMQGDDVDALVIFDRNVDGVYNGNDVVLFSLARNSPTLFADPQVNPETGAAAVFRAQPGAELAVLAQPLDLGLGAIGDDIDALSVLPCAGDPLECIIPAGIRGAFRGDLNCDDLINAFDIDPFVVALTDPVLYEDEYWYCDLRQADINRDGVVNAFDIDPFVELLTGP